MKRDLEIFFEKLLTDQEFREEFVASESAEEGYKIARPYIGDISLEEFKEGLIEMHRKFINRSYKEMNDSDLNDVSGGKMPKSYIDLYNCLSKMLY